MVVVVSTMVDTDIDPMATVNERSSDLLVGQFEAANPSHYRSAAEERPWWGTGRPMKSSHFVHRPTCWGYNANDKIKTVGKSAELLSDVFVFLLLSCRNTGKKKSKQIEWRESMRDERDERETKS